MNVLLFSVEMGTLGNVDVEQDEDDGNAPMVTATVDIKKFLMFLSSMHVNNNCKTICNIVHGKMMKLHVKQPEMMSLQCFLTEMSV